MALSSKGGAVDISMYRLIKYIIDMKLHTEKVNNVALSISWVCLLLLKDSKKVVAKNEKTIVVVNATIIIADGTD